MSIYLDNAATTPLDPRVVESMLPFLTENFGNPSSIHAYGRTARAAVEKARRTVADILGAAPSEIFFTSGGTEANNTVIRNAIGTYGLRHAITSPIEHHAVLHTLEHLAHQGSINLHLVNIDHNGQIDFDNLENLLKTHESTFISLMHGNNEIGNITDVERVDRLCQEYHAYFHSDMVQSLGHVGIKLNTLNIQAISGSAHKFHGPKGVGLMYINADKPLPPLLIGGSQERNMRGGTENVAGIVGLARALEIATEEQAANKARLMHLKKYAMQLLKNIKDVGFNGLSGDLDQSLHKILSLAVPSVEENDMLLFNLDIAGICVSGGSACASGTSIGSHVIDALGLPENTGIIRLSFSKYNTEEELSIFAETLAKNLT